MWTIRRNEQTGEWEVLDGAGEVLTTAPSNEGALAYVAEQARAALAVVAPSGALPDRWTSGPNGIVLAAETGDGRDFTGCTFTYREPPLPLMLQTETEMGHFGASLCGWIDTIAPRPDGGLDAAGWFHDTDDGRKARDILAAQGQFGVSVDPGAVAADFVCTETDDTGWCVDGVTKFLAYEVIGLTMTPFPAFAPAWIVLDAEAAAQEPGTPPATPPAEPPAPEVGDDTGDEAPVAAAATPPGPDSADAARVVVVANVAPVRPPRAWFDEAEPDDDDPRYVPQGGGRIAIPQTITDDGRVFGHIAAAGTCHIGYANQCITPPSSAAGYAHFHVGETLCADGSRVATGTLVAGCDHAPANMLAAEARDHYAHVGLAWADVRASDGRHGVWVSGALRPDITPEHVRVLAASAPSGDWRRIGGHLELIGVQSVNVPGFPVAREALAASGLAVGDARLIASTRDGLPFALVAAALVRPAGDTVEALVAAGTLTRCHECGQARRPAATPAAAAHNGQMVDRAVLARLGEVERLLTVLERRTRPMVADARDSLRRRLGR